LGTRMKTSNIERRTLNAEFYFGLVAQPSRLRVRVASRHTRKHEAGRLVNSQARTPALHPSDFVAADVRKIRVSNTRHEIKRTPCAGLSQGSLSFLKASQSFSLSPGERAGVRASVKTHRFVGRSYRFRLLMSEPPHVGSYNS
jgi:hypothetical protein